MVAKKEPGLMRRRLFPLVLGVMIGMVEGGREALQVLRSSEWLNHGLYNTALKRLLIAVNHRVLIVCVACCVIAAIWTARRRVNRYARPILDLVSIFSLFVVFAFDFSAVYVKARSNIVKTLDDLNASLFKDVMANGAPQIIASVLIIVVGLFVLARVRSKSQKASDESEVSLSEGTYVVASSFLSPVARYAQLVTNRHWSFDAIVLCVFIGLNVASFSIDLANSRALRSRPNIIVIQIDTLRPDHLGCYGYSRKTSQNIDALAAHSIRFEKAISSAPWTAASVAEYMTSRNLKVSLGDEVSGVPVNAVSLSEALKDRGYTTFSVSSNYMAGPSRGFGRGYDSFDGFLDDVSSPKVLSSALKDLQSVKDKRFFMFLLFMDPHSPYVMHDKYDFYPGYKAKSSNPIHISATDRTNRMTPDELKYVKSRYDSEIAFTDQYIGMLMERLKTMHLYNDTLIVLLSDHGEAFGEHGKMEHGTDLYDETLSVPLVIKLPGQQNGTTVAGVFPLLDLFPTIMDTLRFDASALGLNGVSHHLDGLKIVRDTEIYSSTDFQDAKVECIRAKSYKLIADLKTSKQELYSLDRDPSEKKSVLNSEPSVSSALSKMLGDKHRAIENAALAMICQSTSRRSHDDSKILRSLGYLQ